MDCNPAAFATPFVPGPSSLVAEAERKTWKSYDYVIVGGGMVSTSYASQSTSLATIGTAGWVLAARLSEDPYATVLLVEAGKRYVSALRRFVRGIDCGMQTRREPFYQNPVSLRFFGENRC